MGERERDARTHPRSAQREVVRVSVRCKSRVRGLAAATGGRCHLRAPGAHGVLPSLSIAPAPAPREPAQNLVRGLVGLVAHHLVVELVADNELVRELHAVGLHRMRRAIVVLPDLWVVQVRDSVLDPRARHCRRGCGRGCGSFGSANIHKLEIVYQFVKGQKAPLCLTFGKGPLIF